MRGQAKSRPPPSRGFELAAGEDDACVLRRAGDPRSTNDATVPVQHTQVPCRGHASRSSPGVAARVQLLPRRAGLDVKNLKTGGLSGLCIVAGNDFEANPINVAWRLTVTHVRAHHCGDDNHEHGIYMESTRDALIVDSWFYDTPGMGIDFYPDAQGTLVDHVLIDGNSIAVKENLGFSGEAAGGGYSQNHASSNNIVTNSLITNGLTRSNVEPSTQSPIAFRSGTRFASPASGACPSAASATTAPVTTPSTTT
jgi:hypothetical protein